MNPVIPAVPYKYLRVVDNEVIELLQEAKDIIDTEEAQAMIDAPNSEVDRLEISVKDLAKALVQLGVVNGVDLKAKIKEMKGL